MNHRQSRYWQQLKNQVPRLLCQMDRNPLSPTYGCFDRKYWHQRFTDFPSASLQQGVEALAQLYSQDWSENIYHNSPQVLEWIEAAVQYTGTIQNWDGSFDEWYVGERGWAGPTAYILNSLYEAHQRTGSGWKPNTTESFFRVFKKGAQFLIRYEESHVLSNHQALAMLAVYQAFVLTQDLSFESGYRKTKKSFLSNFKSDEGWSVEYDGSDPGYQTATLSFLARLHRLTNEPDLLRLAEIQLGFIEIFFYPDGTFARGIGSRSTSVIFFFAFEYWAQYFNRSAALAERAFESLEQRKVLGPQDHEDHYFLYRWPEFALAAEVAIQRQNRALDEVFPNSVRQKQSHYVFGEGGQLSWVINHQWGGRTLVFDKKKQVCIGGVGDIFIQDSQGHTYTSGSAGGEIVWENQGQLTVTTPFVAVRFHRFSPATFLAFKIFFTVLSVHPKLSHWFKSIIRKSLMYSFVLSPYRLKRTFTFFDSKIVLRSEIIGDPKPIAIFEAHDLPSRYVPQSHYYVEDHANKSRLLASHEWSVEFTCVP
jgi:hypothetical protein